MEFTKENKIFLMMDNNIYKDFYIHYGIRNEKGEIIGSQLSYENYFINWCDDPLKINAVLDKKGGYKNISHLVIQQSLYSNIDLIRILKSIKYFNKNIKVIVYFNKKHINNDVLLHYLAKDKLAYFCFEISELIKIFKLEKMPNYEDYIQKKITKKQMKKFVKS